MPRTPPSPSGLTRRMPLMTLMAFAVFSGVACVDGVDSPNSAGDSATSDTAASAAESSEASGEAAAASETTPSEEPDTAVDAPSEVSLDEGTWDDVEELIAASRGKVVVVDVWSTSCAPCMKEFPHLLALQKTHADDVVCVSMNVDYIGIKSKPPSYYRPRVEKFLTRQQSTIRNFLCTTDSDAFFLERELASIPAVYVYDAEGKLATRFDDSMAAAAGGESFSYEHHINPSVAELLSKQDSP